MPNSLKNSSLANKQFQREKFHLEGKRITKRLKSHLSLKNFFMFTKLEHFPPLIPSPSQKTEIPIFLMGVDK